jgi:hypothetical protein
MPSLVPVSGTSSSGGSIWDWQQTVDPRQFNKEVDDALSGVEEEIGEELVGFEEVEVEVGPGEEEEFDIRTQVAYRSAGPPWLAGGGSREQAIYVE